ncbi:aminotransferase-like domain-containing protein [Roseibium suaedae]|uniref:DNA-binding transcriptional regulator, MocR family, contains an aminotransferase domain n=1 Tax=Roseibium suaedae TaxID=735517 RepID=A0A1M7F079_9HYPH|nr:PLP-dependent aminotransferase family protein [Roseibium suaedae]SHL97381.1 DNA-binding transcriptional regulator, MocR family, contains an aminotransferase domain [Roseibium suaedae]
MEADKPTRTEALMEVVRMRIANRSLSPGDRLPSIRDFARDMKASPSTVAEAYARLEAEGVLRARRGAGFYVTGVDLPPMALAEMGEPREQSVDPFWVSRLSLDARASDLMPGCGWLPASWMPNGAIRKGLRAMSRGEAALLTDYGSTRGALELRRLLIGRFAEEGLPATASQLMLTGSGTQAIDLICRLLLRPGDTVLLDDPCYFNFQALLRAHQVRMVSVPFTPDGPDVELFGQIVAAEKPRLYITNSALHNPTGASLSPQTAYRVLSAAAAHGMTIVEDDIFADFEPALSPRLAVLDGLSRVIRIGSFSKILSASIRCGYIAARQDWIDGLTDLQIATSFSGPSPVAVSIITGILTGGSYRRHMDDIRQRLTTAREETASRLASLGLVPWVIPRGGFYLWCRLPEGLTSSDVARRCMQERVILAPGNVFSVTQSAGPFLRFNVAHMADNRIYAALEKAMKA